MLLFVHFEWFDLVYILVPLILGVILGLYLSRFALKSYLEKNPPINEQMIRTMYTQMGRTPSEKQVKQVMASMSKGYTSGNSKKKKKK